MNFTKKCSKSQFHEMQMKILYICNSRVIWKYHPSDMYIHSHTIGLIDVTELGTATWSGTYFREKFSLKW